MRTYGLKSMMTLISPLRYSERLAPAFDRDGARDQPAEPILVRARKRGRRHLVMPAVRIDRPEYDVVVKHYGAVEAADIEIEHLSGLGDAGQADDLGRRRRVEAAADEGRSARAFYQNVGSEPFEARRIAVVGPAEIAHERLLRTALVVIENVHVEIALLSHQRRQEPDRSGAGDQQRPRLPRARGGRCARHGPRPWRGCWRAPAARRGYPMPDRS